MSSSIKTKGQANNLIGFFYSRLFAHLIWLVNRFFNGQWRFSARMLFGCDMSHFIARNYLSNNRSIAAASIVVLIIWCASPKRLIFCNSPNSISISIQMQPTPNRFAITIIWYLCKYVEIYIKKINKKETKLAQVKAAMFNTHKYTRIEYGIIFLTFQYFFIMINKITMLFLLCWFQCWRDGRVCLLQNLIVISF